MRHAILIISTVLWSVIATELTATEFALSAMGVTKPWVDLILGAPSSGTVTLEHFKKGDFVKKGQIILELDKVLDELTVKRRKLVMDTLKVDLEGMRQVYQKTKSFSKDDLDKKELEYEVSVVDYQIALDQLSKRLLLAPADGIITDLRIDAGEYCKDQDPLLRLVDVRQCYLDVNLDGLLNHGIALGQEISIELEANPPFRTNGKIIYIAPVVDPASGLMEIRIQFENPEGRVRPGVPGRILLPSAP